MNNQLNTQVSINEAVVVKRGPGHFLISSAGRTLDFNYNPGPVFKLATSRGLKVVNNTSQKGQAILAKANIFLFPSN